jgi:hypothetical protein
VVGVHPLRDHARAAADCGVGGSWQMSDHDFLPAINSCHCCCVALAISIAPHSVLISFVRVPAIILLVPGLKVVSLVAMYMLLPNTAISLQFFNSSIFQFSLPCDKLALSRSLRPVFRT